MGRISPGPTRWPLGAERRLVPAKSNLKPQTLERQYPTYETDFSIRAQIQNLPMLPNDPKTGRVSELLADLDHWAGRLTPGCRCCSCCPAFLVGG